jgi:hypothetical protein
VNPDDRTLLARLRSMWERLDPPPAGLAGKMIAAIELDSLDFEYELLALTQPSQPLAGARGSSDASTMTFGGDEVTVMVHVTRLGAGRLRLDGWVAPATTARLEIRNRDGRDESFVDASGRFSLADVPSGMTRLVLHPTDTSGHHLSMPFATPIVEL